MEIRKWHVVDVFYNDHEAGAAEMEVKKYIKQGYSLEAQDSGEPFDNCDQLIKWLPSKIK